MTQERSRKVSHNQITVINLKVIEFIQFSPNLQLDLSIKTTDGALSFWPMGCLSNRESL